MTPTLNDSVIGSGVPQFTLIFSNRPGPRSRAWFATIGALDESKGHTYSDNVTPMRKGDRLDGVQPAREGRDHQQPDLSARSRTARAPSFEGDCGKRVWAAMARGGLFSAGA
ncbi:hypothetical protein NED98_10930 [Sphingomonas sp. MMSM20]|uniref:hypothetical protein n=1 Tax=Sphingomonas lycopersici TaxID=2951807 RepID=UPI002237F082|nr:hypothetical protein [Sphingomonas lycopersici]MCW6530758.1 hypothetical protein [Sphingomonas lycopersici]